MPARPLTFVAVLALLSPTLGAEVRLPSIFGDQMVLQRNQANDLWGWADPNESVTVVLGGQRHLVTADSSGSWRVRLEPLPAGGPHRITVQGTNQIVLQDVMVGEVWLCSGQSNMEWPVERVRNADLEIRTANYPDIRLLELPHVGTQEPQSDFAGRWQPATPETVRDFSAVGYFFGRLLHQSLNVPVGMIQSAWGASAAEAWVRRDVLEADPRYAGMLEHWTEIERTFDPEAAKAKYQQDLKKWEQEAEQARVRGEQSPNRPWFADPMTGQFRPANLYNGMLKPIMGSGFRGVIWYQGETNAGRAYQYRHLFPLLIQNWRRDWGAGDFPFYWVQLADFGTTDETQDAPAQGPPSESAWAELREAQTMTLQLANTGQAVIVDLGEANDIHPVNKQEVAVRLARIALARDYGVNLAYRSPLYREMDRGEGRLTLTFDHVGSGLESHDFNSVLGFAVAGEDRVFHWAQARIVDEDRIEVWSPQVLGPVAVRYAWGDDPVCNVFSKEGLPLTPFRTDDWPGVTLGTDR